MKNQELLAYLRKWFVAYDAPLDADEKVAYMKIFMAVMALEEV